MGGKCILVDIFESVTWAEARYLCEKFGADLVTLESLSFYTALLDFLNSKGQASWKVNRVRLLAGVREHGREC